MQTAWRRSVLAALESRAGSVGIAVACWLLAALIFLKVRLSYEPPLDAWLCVCAMQIVAEAWRAAPGRRVGRSICVLTGQCGAWALGPVAGGRYFAVDELWSLDTIHFGVVTLSLAGGFGGGIVHRMIAVLRRTCDVEPAH